MFVVCISLLFYAHVNNFAVLYCFCSPLESHLLYKRADDLTSNTAKIPGICKLQSNSNVFNQRL